MADAQKGTRAPLKDHPPPSYDTEKKNYAGISVGALDTLGDLRDARDFAEMIVDTVREGLLVLDFELRVLAANESFYRLFSVRPEDTVGRFVYDLGDGQWEIPALKELLAGVLPHQAFFNDYEVEHTFQEVGRRVMLLNARRLNDHQLILLALEDVTERRQGEDDLKKLAEELERRVEVRTRQVRTLSRALVLAEQKERQRIADVLHEDLQQILVAAKFALFTAETVTEKDAEKLDHLLGMALGLTRTLSHEMSLPVIQGDDLTELFNWVAERKRELYGLNVEVEGQASVPDQALRTLLVQLVREFLLNVAKHAESRTARVVTGQSDGYVHVSVEDEGTGFDPAALTGAGGLGLASARQRVELVGGRMDVTSGRGQGTRVSVAIPVT